MKICNILVLSFLFVVSCSFADIAVRLEYGVPSDLLIYSPVPLVFSVTNHGPSACLIPVNIYSDSGYRIRLTRNGEEDLRAPDPGDRLPTNLVWLKPGEQYFILENLNWGASQAGMYEAQLQLKSNGTCLHFETRSENFPVKVVETARERSDNAQYVECWSGDIQSEPVRFRISKPNAAIDVDALKYAFEHADNALSASGKLAAAYEDLMQRFPTSYYTPLAEFYASCFSPGFSPTAPHPLLDYFRFFVAQERLLKEDRSYDWSAIPEILRRVLIQQKTRTDKATMRGLK